MPYGIKKKHGGDSPKNVARMDDCVSAVSVSLAKRYPKQAGAARKVSAIRICKSRLFPD